MSDNENTVALIAALARQAVEDYLTDEAAPDNGERQPRPNPVPLRDMDKAA